jgi:hypothetical protein
MNPVSLNITLDALLRSYTDAGTAPPKVLADNAGRVRTVLDRFSRIGIGPGALVDAVLAALEADRDPAADPAVQRIVTYRAVSGPGIEDTLLTRLDRDIRPALTAGVDDFITAWRPPFDAAVTDLTAAHADLGDIQLTDTSTVVRGGPKAAAAWAQAQQASSTLLAIRGGWSTLARYTHTNDPTAWPVLTVADVPGEVCLTDKLRGANPHPWDLVLAGYQLSLPTVAEYRARLEGIEQARQRRDNALLAARRGESRYQGVG